MEEAIVAYLKVLSQHSPGRIEGNYQNVGQYERYSSKVHLECMSDVLSLELTCSGKQVVRERTKYRRHFSRIQHQAEGQK